MLRQLRNAQHAVVSATDIRVVSPVLMQSLSLKASVVPWAQQDPQLDWSLMCPMTEAHWGHCYRASKVSGRALLRFLLKTTGAL